MPTASRPTSPVTPTARRSANRLSKHSTAQPASISHQQHRPIQPLVTPALRQGARVVAGQLAHALLASSPRSEIITISDISALIQTGIAQGTGQRGAVRVMGAPLTGIVPGMRVYAHKLSHNNPHTYLFESFAPIGVGTTLTLDGYLAHANAVGTAGTTAQSYNGTTVTNAASFTVATSGVSAGWFWSFFFYLTELPSPAAPAVLYTQALVTGSGSTLTIAGTMQFTVDYLGRFNVSYTGSWPSAPSPQVVSTSNNGFVFAPHNIWFVTLQTGLTSALGTLTNVAINGAIIDNSILVPNFDHASPFGGTAGVYVPFFLSDHTGSNAPPAGSWISKFVFGNSQVSSTAMPPYPLLINPSSTVGAYIPTDNSLVASGTTTVGTGLAVYAQYLFSGGSAAQTAVLSSDGNGPTASNDATLYITNPVSSSQPINGKLITTALHV